MILNIFLVLTLVIVIFILWLIIKNIFNSINFAYDYINFSLLFFILIARSLDFIPNFFSYSQEIILTPLYEDLSGNLVFSYYMPWAFFRILDGNFNTLIIPFIPLLSFYIFTKFINKNLFTSKIETYNILLVLGVSLDFVYKFVYYFKNIGVFKELYSIEFIEIILILDAIFLLFYLINNSNLRIFKNKITDYYFGIIYIIAVIGFQLYFREIFAASLGIFSGIIYAAFLIQLQQNNVRKNTIQGTKQF